MKKFIAVAALFAMIFTGASAQFEAGTKYIGASLSGLSLQYSSNERMRFNLDGAAGLFVSDGLLVYANFAERTLLFQPKRHLPRSRCAVRALHKE